MKSVLVLISLSVLSIQSLACIGGVGSWMSSDRSKVLELENQQNEVKATLQVKKIKRSQNGSDYTFRALVITPASNSALGSVYMNEKELKNINPYEGASVFVSSEALFVLDKKGYTSVTVNGESLLVDNDDIIEQLDLSFFMPKCGPSIRRMR